MSTKCQSGSKKKEELGEAERSSPVKLLPDLGFEETTSREFTGWEGRGAMGGCADLKSLRESS